MTEQQINDQTPPLHKTSVSGCFSIDDKKPKIGQEILYEGNLGFSLGMYRNFSKGIGWVTLPDGGIDCFDKWCLK